MPAFVHRRVLSQSGATAIETTLSILLLLLIATAVIELSYWAVVRQLCRLALHETLRIAVSEHGTQPSLDRAFAHTRHSRLNQPWSLRIIDPDRHAIADFQDPFRSAQRGFPVIRNDSQREQHQRALSKWPKGLGPSSGINIFQANVLRVELTYQHKLLSPWFRAWIGSSSTLLRLEAAMQSDFHGTDHRHVDRDKINPIEKRDWPVDIIRSSSTSHFPREQKQALPAEKWQTSAPPISRAPTNVPALHPDLAEQCGSHMCGMDP